MNKKLFLHCIFFSLLFINCFFISCSKNNDYEFKSERDIESIGFGKSGEHYKWYYFSKNGFESVNRPDFAPVSSKGAWTETIRISGANNDENVKNPTGYAIVNRLGMLMFNGDKVTLSNDIVSFTEHSAENLIFEENVPLFSVYKSSFFNDINQNDDEIRPFLLQYDKNTQLSYPILNCNNFCDKDGAQVSDFVWNGNNLICSIKYVEDGRINFEYKNIRPLTSLLSINPANAKKSILVSDCSVNEFREAKNIKDFSLAPQKFISLLDGYAKKVTFSLFLKNAGGKKNQAYYNKGSDFVKSERKCYGINAKEIVSVLFDDGTLYLQGNLSGKYLFNDGKPLVLRLPKLPAGFVYGEYVITENTLFAAWEESMFYETARSGFIAVNLSKLLYDN